jgi:hypothetical protein
MKVYLMGGPQDGRVVNIDDEVVLKDGSFSFAYGNKKQVVIYSRRFNFDPPPEFSETWFFNGYRRVKDTSSLAPANITEAK